MCGVMMVNASADLIMYTHTRITTSSHRHLTSGVREMARAVCRAWVS